MAATGGVSGTGRLLVSAIEADWLAEAVDRPFLGRVIIDIIVYTVLVLPKNLVIPL
jgi:hypothetical protein